MFIKKYKLEKRRRAKGEDKRAGKKWKPLRSCSSEQLYAVCRICSRLHFPQTFNYIRGEDGPYTVQYARHFQPPRLGSWRVYREHARNLAYNSALSNMRVMRTRVMAHSAKQSAPQTLSVVTGSSHLTFHTASNTSNRCVCFSFPFVCEYPTNVKAMPRGLFQHR